MSEGKKCSEINRPIEQQGLFFKFFKEFDFASPHSATTYYGTAIEQIVCAFMQLNPIKINGNYKINFDAFKGELFFEIKSVRKSGKVVLYDFRMKKEEPYNGNLLYVFGVHKVKNAKSNRGLWEQLQEKGIELVVTPASKVHKEAYKQPLNKITTNQHMGYNRKGYADGYRNLPVNPFLKSPSFSSTLEIYEFKIPVWFHYG